MIKGVCGYMVTDHCLDYDRTTFTSDIHVKIIHFDRTYSVNCTVIISPNRI